ncbi:MAG: hypothetical protein QOD07_679, partial [Frankiaceae bacterium]|nr:hypothetical protein [Frankiaceae bacterium]
MRIRVLRDVIRVVAASCAAGATFYLGYAQAHPSVVAVTKKQPHPHDFRTLALIVLTAVAVGAALERPLREFTVDRYERRRDRIARALRLLAWAVHDLSEIANPDMPVPVRPVGASAFVVRGFWKFSYLRRIGHERVNDTPTETPIKWRRGLGIIGECWETGQVLTVDTGSIDAEYGQCTKEEWEKAPPETRRGLSYEQYVKVRGKYGTVIAVAITKNQKVVG